MELIPDIIEEYCEKHSDSEPQILAQLARETRAKYLYARMLSGNLQGHFLRMLCKLMKPENVLEIGSYTGYSAISMAMGIPKKSTIHTIEKNPELEDIITKYIRLSGFENNIKLYIGDALDIIPSIPNNFDVVFIDADKEHYTAYYNAVFDKVLPGGCIIADNVLWSGKVAVAGSNDPETAGIIHFNETIRNDSRIEKLMLPLRDGITLMFKK